MSDTPMPTRAAASRLELTGLEPTSLDRSDRHGSTVMVVVLTLVIVAALVVSFYLDDDQRARFIIWFLAAFSGIGVLALFAIAIGGLQIAGRSSRNDLTKLMADGAIEGHVATDAHGRILYANDTYMKLAGTRDPALLRPVERLFTGTPEVSEAVYRLAQAARERRAASEEIRLVPPLDGQGDAAWYRVRVRPLERAGRPETIWTVQDVTRDRERQENVFQELQNAINYLDHAPAGFFSADATGAIIYMNATLAGWLDHDIAQVGSGGLTLKDVLSSSSAALIDAVVGVAGQVKTEIVDLDLRKRDGQTLPARLFHRVSYGHDGVPGASRTLVLNRSQGEDIAEGLRAAEVRFARFFHNTPIAIATVDKSGKIGRSNATFVRLTADAMKAADESERTIFSAVAVKDHDELRATLASAARGQGDIQPIDIGIAGGSRAVRAFVTPVDSPEDETEEAIIYLIETTEQRALQEHFAQAQKMQAVGQLAGGIAHDFNNVLTAIIGYSDLLLASHRPTDPSFQDIMQIKQNANRAAALVRQLLAFSRRQTLRPQVLQLNDSISDLTILLRRLIGEKVELDMRHARDLWLVKADANQFEQVIVNLAVNARDAMTNGGKLSVKTQNIEAERVPFLEVKGMPSADYVLVEVEDTGTGMPRDVMEKIFEPFFTTKEFGKGTGLGLSMVYGIIKQTGGFIFCDSTVGKGTTFRIFLPRHVPAPEELAVKVEEVKPQTQDLTGEGTILLVEDEEPVRAFGARALNSRGYRVLEASTGQEALELIENSGQKIDLIVSDVVMPEMDGPSLYTELKRRGLNYNFVFASGYAEEAFKKNLPEGGEFAFLPKPYSLKQLVEAVKAAKG
jgi:two-component system cell cycle sensor histidine kinase/response regulator CckA